MTYYYFIMFLLYLIFVGYPFYYTHIRFYITLLYIFNEIPYYNLFVIFIPPAYLIVHNEDFYIDTDEHNLRFCLGCFPCPL
jgi:hypothetical protein